MNIVRMISLVMVFVLIGCTENSSEPGSGGQGSVVQLTVSGGTDLSGVRLGKLSTAEGTLVGVDSLVVGQAIIVLKDIRFLATPDTAHMRDSTECQRDNDFEERGGWHKDSSLRFRGPFIVSLRDTLPVQIALDTIPPGLYSGIKFNIHKLRRTDSTSSPILPDSLLGYSIVVTGMVKHTAAGWVPFTFKADIDEDFMAKGDFTVTDGQTLTPYVLKFELASWFRSPNGTMLDPNDVTDRRWIRYAIKASLKGRMAGGRDRNHDGHPDPHGMM
jgi:hypothetical protein